MKKRNEPNAQQIIGVLLFLLLFTFSNQAYTQREEEINRWQAESKTVTIIRDNWGIPHVFGKTDASCVFGLMYAQCEDDFRSIELNYIEKLGRRAEVEGESKIYDDLLVRMEIDSAKAIEDYGRSPDWLRKLLDAFADGINYYLYKNKSDSALLLKRFEPWYPLLWTDGSIGAMNTAGITARDLERLYGSRDQGPVTKTDFQAEFNKESTGSNGFAIAPSRSASRNSILYINPHVDFYFRPEVHVISEEGLNAYGAVTWGQFFVYQGFNEHCGWMHTSSDVDVADQYEEKLMRTRDKLYYVYDGEERPVIEKNISIRYRFGDSLRVKIIPALFTRHGPIMARKDGKMISVKAMNRSMNALIQCWRRTKAQNFEEFKTVMDIRQNASNNTVYADAEGNIAYWHGDFIPRRNRSFNWSKPVDGSVKATEWDDLHSLDEIVHVYNPPNGWIENCNSTPFTAAGVNSPKKSNYPTYMAPDGENFRGINAARLLDKEKAFTLDKVISAGYDSKLEAFAVLIPALVRAFDKSIHHRDSLYAGLHDPINELRKWDFRAGKNSIATTLAVEWGERIRNRIFRIDGPNADFVEKTKKFAATALTIDLLLALHETVEQLKKSFGTWRVPWGEINRYQRIWGNHVEQFDDSQPSFPMAWTHSMWGCLPAFAGYPSSNTRKRYGRFGNSFVCAVEFGKKIRAKSLLTGGESGHPNSKHFADQAQMYAEAKFKDVLFYREDIDKHAERTYHPGE